jgi:protein-disulfide isomerase
MDKRFGLIVVTVIAVIIGIFYFTKGKDSTAGSNSNNTGTVSQHTKGAGSVELVEYGDFECPACGQFYPIVDEIIKKYSDKIKFTFKHFPLDTIHANARAAHRAAEAAGQQGKFFDMYDLIYKNQSSWRTGVVSNPVPVFESYAEGLGLDMTKFKEDFASSTINSTINADQAEGKSKYKVDSTPTFVLNGQVLKNSDIGGLDLFSAKIDEQLKTSAQ